MDPETEAFLQSLDEYLVHQNDDVLPENEATHQPATLVPSTYSNTWPSNSYSEHQITLNSDPLNEISCTLPTVDQNQLPHSTPQNHTSPSTYPPSLSNVLMHQNQIPDSTPQDSAIASTYPSSLSNVLMHQNQIPDSTPQEYAIASTYPSSLSNVPMHQNQIPDSTPQDYAIASTYPPSLSNVSMHHQCEVLTETPIHQVGALPQNYFNHQIEPVDQNQILDSTPQHHTMPSSRSSLLVPSMHQFEPQSLSNGSMNQPPPIHQFNPQIPYNFPMHHQSPNPMDELSPQVLPSSVPMQMQLSMNQFNLQNTTQAIHQQSYHMSPRTTMFPEFPSSDSFHAHSTPQNHIVHSVTPICQHNPQPHQHEVPPLSSPKFSSNIWLQIQRNMAMKPEIDDYVCHLEEQLLDVNGNTNDVPKKEVGEVEEYQDSLKLETSEEIMMDLILQKVHKIIMDPESAAYLQCLEEQPLNNSDGVPENEASEPQVPSTLNSEPPKNSDQYNPQPHHELFNRWIPQQKGRRRYTIAIDFNTGEAVAGTDDLSPQQGTHQRWVLNF